MSGQKVLISVPLGGDTPAARTMQAPGLVNAGTYGAQPPPIAHAGEWFRFFQVLDCSATVQGKVKLAPPRSEGYCSGRWFSHFALTSLQFRASERRLYVPVFYVGDISERADFCGGSLTSITQTLVILRCSGFPYPQQGTRLNMRFRRV